MEHDHIWNLLVKKLSGEISAEDKQELEKLLRSNPDLHYPVQTIMDMWNSVRHQNKEEAEQAFDKHIDRMKQLKVDFDHDPGNADDEFLFAENKSAGKKRRIFTGFAVLVLVLIGLWLYPTLFSSKPLTYSTEQVQKTNSEISTRNGSKTNVMLPDGTQVWLNAGSKLTYDKNYGNTLREVSLAGEAFFDVVRNIEKPFIIHTARIDVKVLGTRFNVKSYPSDKTTEATLIRGSIEVSIKDRPSEKIFLRPNEKIIVTDEDNISSPSPATHNLQKNSNEPIVAIRKPMYDSANGTIIETSWVENKLIFHDEAFTELSEQMERWYGVTIHFNDPEKKQLRFTGSFKNETVQQALDALKLSNNKFNYQVKDNEIVIF